MKKITKSIKIFVALLSLMAIKMNAQTYCTSGAIVSADEEIYNVMLNGAQTNNLYSFTNGCSTPAPGPGSSLSLYSNFKTLGALTTIVAGSATTWSVAENECDGPTYYYNGIGIWIDFNQNGLFTDPGENIYLDNTTIQSPRNLNGSFTVPTSALTGSTVMRVIVAEGYSGTSLTPCLNSYGYGETEDYRVDVVPPVPCSGTPGANSVVGPTAAICPNSSAYLSLANNYTVGGITFQWQSSTASNVGPWTTISGATNNNYTTPSLTVATYYQAIITCTNSAGVTTATVSQVLVQPTTTNTVPYFEGFEGITSANKLPNCSWAASNLPATCQTYNSSNTMGRIPRTGTNFAAFYYSPTGTNWFYTNGIWLDAGITYSASLWFETDYSGAASWSNISILLGTSQTPTAMTQTIAANNSPISNVYRSLSNTFTVQASGLYYVGIKGQSTGVCCAYYLNWDDLSIIIPCTTSPNKPSISVSPAGSATVCSGDDVNITAAGADTYTWSTGANGAAMAENPIALAPTVINYNVIGTNMITGCRDTASQAILVNPVPDVQVFSNKPNVCSGSQAILTAFGANSFTWSTNALTNVIAVNPTTGTSSTTVTYTVLATNQYGCTGTKTQGVGVWPLPNVTANSDRADMCVGESVILTGNGAVTYQWVANTSASLFVGSPITVNPTSTSVFTVTGTDINGCQKSGTVVQNVNDCVGIKTISASGGIKIYPNPTAAEFTIESNNNSAKVIQVTDLTGRVIVSSTNNSEKVNVNLGSFANGIYYVKIKSENSVDVIKVVKQ